MSNLIREQFQAMINQQVSNSLTDDLLTLYELDDAMPNMLEILNDPDPKMRKYAAVNLRLVVEKQWEALEDNGSAETYLNHFLQFLHKETDDNVIDNFMHSIERVLEKYGSMWLDLFNFAFEIAQTRTVSALIILIYATHTVENDFICQIADSIIQLVNHAATTITDKKGKVRAFQLFAEAFDRDEPLFQPYPDSFLEIFNLMIQNFVNDLKNPGQSISQAELIVNLESDVISTVLRWNFPFVDFAQTYEYLLQLLQDDSISPDLIYSVFDPIQAIIETHGNIIREYLPTTLELFLNYSAAKCVEGSFSDQSLNIGEVVDALSNHMLPSDFIKYITEYRSKASTFGEHYAWMLILNHACQNIMDEIEMHINDILQPLLDILETGNESLAQISMLTMYSIIEVCERAAEGYTDKILESVLAYKEGELEGTVIAMCQVISILFSYSFAETEVVIDVVAIIVETFEKRTDATEKKYLMEVFNMAIQSCESSCIQFDASVYQIIEHYSQTTEQEELAAKPDALEAVGSIVSFYPELSEEQIGFYVDLLINNLCEVDDIDNLNSVSRAFSTIIKNRKEAINLLVATSILMSLMTVIDAIYKNYVSQDFPESELAQSQITTVGSFINLETRIIKSFKNDFLAINDQSSDEEKEILRNFLTNVNSLAIQFQQYGNEPYLLQYLLNLGLQIFDVPFDQLEKFNLSRESFIKEYMLKLMACFPEDDKDNVMSALRNASKIVKKRQNSQEETPFAQYVPELYDYAIKACNRELPVLEEVDEKFKYDPDIIYQAHNLISNIILYYPETVDLSAFLNYVVNAIDKFGEYEICEVFSPLASYPHCVESIPDEILDLAVKSLDLCDFSHPPNPIYFFLELTEEKPQLMTAFLQQYPQFIELLFNILTKEDNRERYYAETIANAASLVLSLCNKIGQIPIDQFLPHIVNKLPYKRDTVEGKKIALWVVDLVQNNKLQVDKSVEFEILRGLFMQMSMNDSELESYEFSDDEKNKIVQVIMSISRSNPDFMPTILENISDVKKILFQKHTNIEL